MIWAKKLGIFTVDFTLSGIVAIFVESILPTLGKHVVWNLAAIQIVMLTYTTVSFWVFRKTVGCLIFRYTLSGDGSGDPVSAVQLLYRTFGSGISLLFPALYIIYLLPSHRSFADRVSSSSLKASLKSC